MKGWNSHPTSSLDICHPINASLFNALGLNYLSSPTMSDTSSSSKTHLPKGSACMNCRRRKIKCDGLRPVCSPCSSSDAFRDCEYVERGTSSKTQALEAQIAILENRIQELEQQTDFSQFHQFHDSSSSTDPFSFQLHEIILRSFLHHSSIIGFFLDQARFADSVTLPNVMKPSAALLSTAYLWGIHLSDSAVILNGSYSVSKRKFCWHTISSARRECWKEGTIPALPFHWC